MGLRLLTRQSQVEKFGTPDRTYSKTSSHEFQVSKCAISSPPQSPMMTFLNCLEGLSKLILKTKKSWKSGIFLSLFPNETIGVAQGSALSALAGNIALREFDAEMNSRGLVCVRYIDDFMLLGGSKLSSVRARIFESPAKYYRVWGWMLMT